MLKGGVAVGDLGDLMTAERSLAHGHVMAVLGFEPLLFRHDGGQVLCPDSRLATARRLSPAASGPCPPRAR